MAKKESDAFARVLAHSFGRKEEESAVWISRYPHDVVRVLRDARGNVAAGAIVISMGQFFGGERVAMAGIQGVGVAPEARGHGAATELMRRIILECGAGHVPISSLYPATQELYRRVGYEQAGHRFACKVPLSLIGARKRTLEVRPVEESDRDEIRAVYRTFAQEHEGTLDRTDPIWHRIEFPPPTREIPARAFKVLAPGKGGKPGPIEGYIYLMQQTVDGGRYDVHVHDMVALTERAGRRLWSFLSSYSTVGNDMHWFCGPSHPMLALLSEQPYKLSLLHFWMVRVCDVPRAIESRGYAIDTSTELVLNITDPLIRANNASWLVRVSDGRAHVAKHRPRAIARKKSPENVRSKREISLGVRSFASLFSGFYSASHLRRLGWLAGDDRSVRTADGLFALRSPWMSDMF